MLFDALLWLGLAVGVGGLLSFLGLGALLRGFRSGRNAYVAAFGDETPVASLADGGGTTVARLEGTVTDVPDPVETAGGDEVGIYRLKAVLKNYRNLGDRFSHYRELRTDATRLDGVVVAGPGDRRCLLTAPDQDDHGWGNTQRASKETGLLLVANHYVSTDWTDRTTYTDDRDVPDDLVAYLSERGADTDFGLERFGVAGLTVAEDVVDVGDTVRLVGPVEPATAETPAEPPTSAADGGGGRPVLELTPGCTVTTESWRTLAWAETKEGLKQLPMGAVFLGSAAVTAFFSLRNAGLL